MKVVDQPAHLNSLRHASQLPASARKWRMRLPSTPGGTSSADGSNSTTWQGDAER